MKITFVVLMLAIVATEAEYNEKKFKKEMIAAHTDYRNGEPAKTMKKLVS